MIFVLYQVKIGQSDVIFGQIGGKFRCKWFFVSFKHLLIIVNGVFPILLAVSQPFLWVVWSCVQSIFASRTCVFTTIINMQKWESGRPEARLEEPWLYDHGIERLLSLQRSQETSDKERYGTDTKFITQLVAKSWLTGFVCCSWNVSRTLFVMLFVCCYHVVTSFNNFGKWCSIVFLVQWSSWWEVPLVVRPCGIQVVCCSVLGRACC